MEDESENQTHLLDGVVGDHYDRVGVGEPHVAHVAVPLQQLPVVARHVLRAAFRVQGCRVLGLRACAPRPAGGAQPVRRSHDTEQWDCQAACASSLGGRVTVPLRRTEGGCMPSDLPALFTSQPSTTLPVVCGHGTWDGVSTFKPSKPAPGSFPERVLCK